MAEGIVNDIVQSDIPETVAAGVEGFYKGALPKGTNDLLEKKLGGANQEQIDARSIAHPIVSNVAEFAGNMFKDIASTAVAGPLALYGNALLNTIGNTLNKADNADPALTRESMNANLMSELFSAGVGHAGGALIGKLLPSGKAVMSAAESAAKGAFTAAEDVGEGTLSRAAKQALEQGIFDKGRETGRQIAKANKAEMQGALNKFLGMADEATPEAAQLSDGVHKLYFDEIAGAMEQLKFSGAKAARTELAGVAKELQRMKTALKPSEMLDIEDRIADAGKVAAKSGDSDAMGAIQRLQQRVGSISDDLFTRKGVSPDQVREFKQSIDAQQAAIDAIPKRSLAKDLGRLALHGPALAAAHATGIPGAGLVALGIVGRSTPEAGLNIGKSALGYGAQKAYNIGSALTEFDKGIFAQWLGKEAGVGAEKAAQRALSGAAQAGATLSGTGDHIFPQLEAYEINPQLYIQHLKDTLDASPLAQSDKEQALQDNQMAMQYLQMNKPRPANPSPFAPAGARAIPKIDQITFKQKIKGVLDPESVLSNPTEAGLEAVRMVHPATYSAYVNEIVKNVGPNTQHSGRARQLLNTLGVDISMEQAGFTAQNLYKPSPPRQQGSQPQKGGDKINLSVVNSSSTALDKVEGSEQ